MFLRLPWQLGVAAILLVLLAVLATLQYRWLGAVSDAERDRMRAGLRARTVDFAREFDGELTRTYVAFNVDSEALDRDSAGTLANAYQRWRASAAVPDLVRTLYLVDQRSDNAAKELRRLDVDRRVLEVADWPDDLAASLGRAERMMPPAAGLPGPMPLLMADAVDAQIPALFVPVPFLKKVNAGRQFTLVTGSPVARIVVVVMDRDRLKDRLVEPLVAKYFGDRSVSDYLVTIAGRDDRSSPVYNTGDAPVEPAAAEVTLGLFNLRLDAMDRLAVARGVQVHMTQHVAITVVRRPSRGEGGGFPADPADQSAWQVRVRHRSGSLDAIVAQSRRRNLAIGLGVLGLLGASMVLIVAAAQRQQRLARQQMEFVAAVSHELRTPLAVICSAGENLADGVVSDGSQVRRYGSLIQSEGRRLHDMVERVLAFSGIVSAPPMRQHAAIDFSTVVADAVDAASREARERGVSVAVHANGAAAPVNGDVDALRSALLNIVGNAIKYSPAGSTVDVSLEANDHRIRLSVVDRGLGIDREDLPHIFKPFYRGRRATDAQVRGTGVGLSVVRHVIDGHHGSIHVESRPGEGTTVVVDLPPAPASSDTARPAPDDSRLGARGSALAGVGEMVRTARSGEADVSINHAVEAVDERQ